MVLQFRIWNTFIFFILILWYVWNEETHSYTMVPIRRMGVWFSSWQGVVWQYSVACIWYIMKQYTITSFVCILSVAEINLWDMRLYLRRDFASKRLLLLCCYFRRLNLELIARPVRIIPKPFNAPWKYKQLVVLLFFFFLCCSLSRLMLPLSHCSCFVYGPWPNSGVRPDWEDPGRPVGGFRAQDFAGKMLK